MPRLQGFPECLQRSQRRSYAGQHAIISLHDIGRAGIGHVFPPCLMCHYTTGIGSTSRVTYSRLSYSFDLAFTTPSITPLERLLDVVTQCSPPTLAWLSGPVRH